jgi:hypothetical protein
MSNLFEREVFERWLAEQPDDRAWNFSDCQHCVASSFVKEMRGFRFASSGHNYTRTDEISFTAVRYPDWLYDLLGTALEKSYTAGHRRILYARDLKRHLGLIDMPQVEPPNLPAVNPTSERAV